MDAVSVAANKFIEKQLSARKVEALELLPKEIRREIKKEARRIAHDDVFGVGHRTDKAGNPIEQGLGSPSNMTQQHIDAYVKSQTDKKFRDQPEPGFEDNLKKMRAQLAECQARRRAEMGDDDGDDD